MHVGIFVEERRRDTSEAAAFRDAVDLAEAAEREGLDDRAALSHSPVAVA